MKKTAAPALILIFLILAVGIFVVFRAGYESSRRGDCHSGADRDRCPDGDAGTNCHAGSHGGADRCSHRYARADRRADGNADTHNAANGGAQL